jgi:hypothetical protein
MGEGCSTLRTQYDHAVCALKLDTRKELYSKSGPNVRRRSSLLQPRRIQLAQEGRVSWHCYCKCMSNVRLCATQLTLTFLFLQPMQPSLDFVWPRLFRVVDSAGTVLLGVGGILGTGKHAVSA